MPGAIEVDGDGAGVVQCAGCMHHKVETSRENIGEMGIFLLQVALYAALFGTAEDNNLPVLENGN